MATTYSTGWVPQHHRDITLGRIASFLENDMFASANIRSCMQQRRAAVQLAVYSVPVGESS